MKAASIILIILLLAGCAHVPSYTLNATDATYSVGSPRHAMKIAVALFVDKRPKGWGMSRRLKIKEKGVSKMIVKHFDHVKLFAHQEVVGSDFQRPTSKQLVKLKSKGYDMILIGSIITYTGNSDPTTLDKFVSKGQVLISMSLIFPPLLLPVGLPLIALAFYAPMEKVDHWGQTNLTELKIIETASGNTIWEGQASGSAREQYRGQHPYRITDEALKNAVTSFVEQLENISFQ